LSFAPEEILSGYWMADFTGMVTPFARWIDWGQAIAFKSDTQ
jgi:hypothetical protein